MGILDGLNDEQLAAVLHDDGPQLVVAGAGTGKTQVITRRIARLIEAGKAKPTQILALTFTEKAAREMQDRLYELIGWESFQVPIMTFHAFGAQLLGRFASHIGRSTRGGLLNDTQKTLLLQQHLGRINMEYYGAQADMYEFLEGIVGYVGLLQNAGVSATRYSQYVAQLIQQPGDLHPREVDEQADLARLYTLYEEIKAETGSYDYSDQLYLPLEILRARPNLAERLAGEYHYVLVDEYQDTNAVQDELLRTFIGRTGNIFAVGDDDQAIYGFRGAEINNILGFAEHFELPEPAVLVQNYRSGQAVLDVAYLLIQHNNPLRLEAKLGINKRLLAQHDESRVSFVPYPTNNDEIEGVLGNIEARLRAGEAPASIAVLAASHAPLKTMAKTMARRGVPYAISTTVSIFDQPELLALWYLLGWLTHHASEEAVAHILMGPFIRWTPADMHALLEQATSDMTSLEEALRSGTAPARQAVVSQLDEWRGWAAEQTVSQLAFRLVFDTGMAARWQQAADDSPRMVRVFEDLHRLLEHMQDFETVAVSPDLGSYLAAFPKPPALEVSEPLGDTQGVQLLTVHASKGLEFETVYVIGCTQRTWSATRAMGRMVPEVLSLASDLPPDHELRRLMYVAATRAKTELILSAGLATKAGAKQAVSGFITEMLGDDVNLSLEARQYAKTDSAQELLNKLQRFYPLSDYARAGKLPFESDDGWLDLSVTALGAYEYCPFEFYLQHVLKISQPMGPQLAFGSVLHRVFEVYFKGRLSGAEPSLGELGAVLEEAWSAKGYPDKTSAEADLSLAKATLGAFYEREHMTPRVVVGSEMPVRFEVPEAKLRLRGKIDALFERSDGLELRDFKTGRSQTDSEKLAKSAKTNFQLRCYALACEQLRGTAPAAVVLDYVVTGTEGEAQLSPTILRNHRDKLRTMADSIRQRDFAPNPSAMHECAAIRFYGTGEQDELAELAAATDEVRE